MAIRRITLSDIAFGQPLAWDIFSMPSALRPLIEKGKLVAPGQLDDWLSSGLYADTGVPGSVLQGLNQINRRLERTLMALREQGSADTELRSIAQELIDTLERQPDIALAAIFLNQIAGTYALRHCTEAAIVVCLIARALGKAPPEVLIVTAAALTMNVGMVRHSELFHGNDGVLSSRERDTLRRHPGDSVALLRSAGVTDEHWLELVLLHHENDDGTGYPEGRLGSEIAQNAKLIALADRYCALVSARNYRRSLLPPMALARLASENAVSVEHPIVQAFLNEIGPYPPGTLVRLDNSEMGVVSSRRDGNGAMRVHALRGADGPLPLPRMRSTDQEGCAIVEALHEDDAKLRFTMQLIWGELASL